MTLIEINFTDTLREQFKQHGRGRQKYYFIDCTEAAKGLEVLGDTSFQEFMQRLTYKVASIKPDIVVSAIDFGEHELPHVLGKKGIFVLLEKNGQTT